MARPALVLAACLAAAPASGALLRAGGRAGKAAPSFFGPSGAAAALRPEVERALAASADPGAPELAARLRESGLPVSLAQSDARLYVIVRLAAGEVVVDPSGGAQAPRGEPRLREDLLRAASARLSARRVPVPADWRSAPLEGGEAVLLHRGARRRGGEAELFLGGIGTADSLDPLAAESRRRDPGARQGVLLLPGDAPGSSAREDLGSTDALDVARAIERLAAETGASRVRLHAHSYAGLAVIEMLKRAAQAGGEAAEDRRLLSRALGLLGGVVLHASAAHTEPGSWDTFGWAGPRSFEALAALARGAVAALDDYDAVLSAQRGTVDALRRLADPFGAVAAQILVAQAAIAGTEAVRAAAARTAGASLLALMRGGLPPAPHELVRPAAWFEGQLRRVAAVAGYSLSLEEASAIKAALRRHGATVLALFPVLDPVLPWPVARLLPAAFGVRGLPAAHDPPDAGATFTDGETFVLRAVAGGHLKPTVSPAAAYDEVRGSPAP